VPALTVKIVPRMFRIMVHCGPVGRCCSWYRGRHADGFAGRRHTRQRHANDLLGCASVIEGDCAAAEAKSNHIILASGPYEGYALEQSDYNQDYMWWNGTNSPVELKACDTTNPQDLFY
jgi:hypothetical protein